MLNIQIKIKDQLVELSVEELKELYELLGKFISERISEEEIPIPIRKEKCYWY